MNLYITPNSPYARITRVAAIESGLAAKISVIDVKTRDSATDYFAITPLARVPALVDGDILIADTHDICAQFDTLIKTPRWCLPETAKSRTLRHISCGFLDGIAVWLRESGRPVDQQSASVIKYEEHRARQALKWLEYNADPKDPADFTTLTLACALDIASRRGMANNWPDIAPRLMQWSIKFAGRASMQQTRPN